MGHGFLHRALAEVDPEIAAAIKSETARQNDTLELIASENHVSTAVLTAMGSVFTNKYAEGYPGKRYYGGCGPTDVVETIAIDRAKKLFGAEHANVQPHSGSQANMAVYFTVLKPGDTIMGMDLSHGGHLTHGHPLSYSGRDFKVVGYHVRKEDELHRLRRDGAARAGAQAAPRHLRRLGVLAGDRLRPDPRDLRQVGIADDGRRRPHRGPDRDRAIIPRPFRTPTSSPPRRTRRCAGRAAAWCSARSSTRKTSTARSSRESRADRSCTSSRPRPCRFAEALHAGVQGVPDADRPERPCPGAAPWPKRGFRIVSGGTDNHLFMTDVFSKGITGKDAQNILEAANITVNKNTIPFDTQKPMVASGVRIGTPAVTTRGLRRAGDEEDCAAHRPCSRRERRTRRHQRSEEGVRELCERFPIY